jgi:hypothetical protein
MGQCRELPVIRVRDVRKLTGVYRVEVFVLRNEEI